MKKVLIFRHATAIGGAERYLFNLVAATKQTVNYHVVTNSKVVADHLEGIGVKTTVIPYAWEPFSRKLALLFYLRQLIDRPRLMATVSKFFGSDKGTIFCHSMTDKLLVTSVGVAQGHKVIWLEHGPMVGRLLKWPPLVRRYAKLSTLTQRIICVSQLTARNTSSAGVDKVKLRVIYNGTPEIDHQDKHSDIAQTLLVITNRLVPEKGYLELFQALALVRDLNWQLDIIGDGPLEKVVRQRAVDLGLQERITFHGFQDNISDYLKRADVFINPTTYPGEGLPISNIEALAAGLLVVTSRSGGAVETIEDNISGLFVDPTNSISFGETLRQAITQPDLRTKLGQKGRERWRRLFSLDKMIRETLEELNV